MKYFATKKLLLTAYWLTSYNVYKYFGNITIQIKLNNTTNQYYPPKIVSATYDLQFIKHKLYSHPNQYRVPSLQLRSEHMHTQQPTSRPFQTLPYFRGEPPWALRGGTDRVVQGTLDYGRFQRSNLFQGGAFGGSDRDYFQGRLRPLQNDETASDERFLPRLIHVLSSSDETNRSRISK